MTEISAVFCVLCGVTCPTLLHPEESSAVESLLMAPHSDQITILVLYLRQPCSTLAECIQRW